MDTRDSINEAPVLAQGLGAKTERKGPGQYEVGDTIAWGGGETIAHIYQQSSEFIVYRSENDRLGYEIRERNPKYDAVVAELSKVIAEAESQLRGAYKKDLTALAAQSLRSAFLSPNADNVERYFDVVRKFVFDRGPIQTVYGYGSGFMVFLNKAGVIECQCKEIPLRLQPVFREFQRLQHIAKCTLGKSDTEEVYSILGSDLASAFRSLDESDPSSFLVSSREFIVNRSEALLRSRYVRDSMISALLLLVILTPITYYLRTQATPQWIISLGAIGGVIGASISIIQRGVYLSVNPFVPISHVAIQGMIRILLGAVFGALLIVASWANITLGIIQGNPYSMFVFSVVAGLSERFIPDILDRIASDPPESATIGVTHQ